MAFNEHISSAKQATYAFFRKLFITIIVLIILAVVGSFALTKVAYSEGERAGVVSKFSKRGVIFKTFEGELNVGAQGQVGNMVNNMWSFTVNDNDQKVVQALETAMLTGKRVRLHYEQRYMKFSWMGETEYFVTRIDFAP
ncbi:hypothetical protein [Flectobacillus major]|jgi:flagellar basal body-associated protein FliL|uniref:hypothetical protein n=1 Tax=Flectobacillus major TaxID=103 RepID=UPI000410E904|nr:hypothetical protein [Flectobacillus major]